MPEPFHDLRERLLRAGVAPRHVGRYLGELTDHLADLSAEEVQAGRTPDEARATALKRLGEMDELASAMIRQRQFQSWSARAPWVMFSMGPLLMLAAAYLVACFYLWLGWRLFLPGADTPFGSPSGPIDSLGNIYFQAGKFYYYLAPIFVGWVIALIAARQRLKAVWPATATFLVAWMGASAQIQASRTLVPGRPGNIRMSFFGGSSLTYACLILAFTLLPYVMWRFQNTDSCKQ